MLAFYNLLELYFIYPSVSYFFCYFNFFIIEKTLFLKEVLSRFIFQFFN